MTPVLTFLLTRVLTQDPELLTFTLLATVSFALIALFFGTVLRRLARARRLKLPHRTLELVFRLWFAVLALGALYLTLFGRAGLFPKP